MEEAAITIKENGDQKPFYRTEIPSDWDTPKFGMVFLFLKSFPYSREYLTSEKTGSEIRNIHYGDIHSTYENEILDFQVDKTVPYLLDDIIDIEEFETENFPSLIEGDLIIADASEDYEGVCDCVELKNVKSNKVVAGLHTYAARANENEVSLGFRTYVLNHQQVVRELRRIATGTSVYGVSKKNLSEVIIALPTISEQKAIARILSTWDKAIGKMLALINQKELQKSWLLQQLITGKKRLKGFSKEQFKKVQINEVLVSVRNSLKPKEEIFYKQIGIRSHGKGIFHKELVSGKSLGNKRVFWVEPDCLIINIVFAWEQAVALTTESESGMIASHRFPMYKAIGEKVNLPYALYFFKSPRGKKLLEDASPGGAGRNKTLGQSGFMKQRILLPSIDEQLAVVQVLQAADNEILLLKSKYEKLKEQKKGLMQQLLTGKIRIK